MHQDSPVLSRIRSGQQSTPLVVQNDMVSTTRNQAQQAVGPSAGVLTDQLYWLSKVDGDLPKASIASDFKRATASARAYESVGFDLDPDVVQSLKGLDSARGVSDLETCLCLLAALLAKYGREDSVIIGLKANSAADDPRAVVPMQLGCRRDASVLATMLGVANALHEMAGRSTAAAAELPQILGADLSSHRYPLFDMAVAVGGSGTSIDLAAYPVDIALVFETAEGRIRGRAQYATDLYERATINRMVAHLLNVARQAAAKPATMLGEIELLSAQERGRVLTEFNARRADYPLHSTFHALFEAQAALHADATAVIHQQVRLSYAELNRRANQLAHVLLAQGLKKGAFVGILLNRSGDFVVAMLAVFKAGGAYVPLDPTYPRDRIQYMLADSEAEFLISSDQIAGGYADVWPSCAGLRVLVSVDRAMAVSASAGLGAITLIGPDQITAATGTNPGLALAGSDRAYMIYTSGSTGRPKGAICRHDGALNHLFGELDGIGVAGAFSFLQTAASSSDISVWQFMAPLLFGGPTVIVDYEDVVDPAMLLALMRQHQVTVAEPVPVVLRALIDLVSSMSPEARALPHLHCMMCTGEALPAELVDRWLALYPHIPIANTYGPTETSDDVTLMVMREPLSHKHAVAPIGRPLPNVCVYVLDRDLHPVPVGVPGELCIGGIAVGEGYWRQADKTEAAFVASPFPEVAVGRMYRTGDLSRWMPDGTIEFLGRIDQQVKVRGFRIEPGEVEAVMTKHPGVQDAAVVVVEDGAGNRRLVGHFVPHKDALLSAADLRQYLKSQLADHMVPAALIALGALPLTPLGKVDRRALSRIESLKGVESESHVAPRNATEQMLAQAWARILGTDKVGVHDNFFEIGGDSILTIQVVAELRRSGFDLAPRQVFRFPTVAELATHLSAPQPNSSIADTSAAAALESSWDKPKWQQQLAAMFPEIEDVYPLSATQRGIYFQSLLVAKASGAYVEQIAFDLVGDLNEAVFCQAWQHAVDTEQMLRTAVVRRGAPHPLQVVVRKATLLPVTLDFRAHASNRQPNKQPDKQPDQQPDQQSARFDALMLDQRMTGFDLKRAPLSRVMLVRLAENRWRVLWSYHHVILDGWSEPLILRSVFQAYDAIMAGAKPSEQTEVPYRNFVAWSESQDVSLAQHFWQQQLQGFTHPVTIKDPSPAVTPPSSHEVSHGWDHTALSTDETALVDSVARRNGLTLSTLLHGAWSLLVHRRSQADDVIVGSIASGRQASLQDIESIRGLVVVAQPLRSRTAGGTSVSSWLRRLQLQMAEMRDHEHTPLASIQQWCDVPAERRPLFDSIVVVGNYAGSDLPGCSSAALQMSNVAYCTQPLYALTLFATPGSTLSISLVYDKRRYASQTAQQITLEYRQMLLGICENPEQRVTSLLQAIPA